MSRRQRAACAAPVGARAARGRPPRGGPPRGGPPRGSPPDGRPPHGFSLLELLVVLFVVVLITSLATLNVGSGNQDLRLEAQ
ncbi:MAG: prepilin-type N-terminal cleavage/methylation domain-containing protein, partial [Haliea sp.]